MTCTDEDLASPLIVPREAPLTDLFVARLVCEETPPPPSRRRGVIAPPTPGSLTQPRPEPFFLADGSRVRTQPERVAAELAGRGWTASTLERFAHDHLYHWVAARDQSQGSRWSVLEALAQVPRTSVLTFVEMVGSRILLTPRHFMALLADVPLWWVVETEGSGTFALGVPQAQFLARAHTVEVWQALHDIGVAQDDRVLRRAWWRWLTTAATNADLCDWVRAHDGDGEWTPQNLRWASLVQDLRHVLAPWHDGDITVGAEAVSWMLAGIGRDEAIAALAGCPDQRARRQMTASAATLAALR